MTRVTSLAYKRKFHEAGFQDEDEVPVSPEPQTVDPGDSKETEIPAKKKRKRNRSKKTKENGADSTHPATGEHANGGELPGSQAEASAKPLQKKAKHPHPMRKDKLSRKQASEDRRQKRISDRNANTVCFACRQSGHAVRDCPNADGKDGQTGASDNSAIRICYRCGSKKHPLSRCKEPIPENPDNPLPFASCFVCNSVGHLAGTCPQNKEKGIYPNGGSCKLCGETSHFAKDCGLRGKDVQKDAVLVGHGRDAGADEDDFHVVSRRRKEVDDDDELDGQPKKAKGKIKRLVGGKIIVRVPDPPKPPPQKVVPRAPPVKTVVF